MTSRSIAMKQYLDKKKSDQINTSIELDTALDTSPMYKPTVGALEAGLGMIVNDAIQTTLERYSKLLDDNLKNIIKVKDDAEKLISKGATLNISVADIPKGKVEGLKHKSLATLITLVSNNLPTLLVGMAGTGKTHAGEQVASALDIPFYALSVGAQTSKSDIIGYMHGGGGYVRTLFREAYEHGGVFLMDEIDAGNSNVLIQINAALSNNYCAFPDGMIKRHDTFRFIATANTFGMGASRMYVGRNQLDAATLDRFSVMNWDVDEELETMLVSHLEHGPKWLAVVHEVRKLVDKQAIRALVTPRATLRGVSMLTNNIDFDNVLQMSILNGIPSDKHEVIKDIAQKIWNK